MGHYFGWVGVGGDEWGWVGVRALFDNTHISDITLQRLSLISNSEISISVAPWSSFYVFKDILCTKQPFADVFKIGVFMT